MGALGHTAWVMFGAPGTEMCTWLPLVLVEHLSPGAAGSWFPCKPKTACVRLVRSPRSFDVLLSLTKQVQALKFTLLGVAWRVCVSSVFTVARERVTQDTVVILHT